MEGFLCYEFGGLIFRGAYIWRAYMYFQNFTLLTNHALLQEDTFSSWPARQGFLHRQQ